MSQDLTFETIKYVFNSFGINSKLNNFDSLSSDKFKTSYYLSFEDLDGNDVKRYIYSCQIKTQEVNLTHIFCDVSFEEKEYMLITIFNNNSFIGNVFNSSDKSKTNMFHSYNGLYWTIMPVLSQCNYLSGLEQLKLSTFKYEPSELSDEVNIVDLLKGLYSHYQDDAGSSEAANIENIELSESISK